MRITIEVEDVTCELTKISAYRLLRKEYYESARKLYGIQELLK